MLQRMPRAASVVMPDPSVVIRHCHTVPEFEQMVELEFAVWGFGERDVVPSQMHVVAAKIGGQVLGAFVGDRMVGIVISELAVN